MYSQTRKLQHHLLQSATSDKKKSSLLKLLWAHFFNFILDSDALSGISSDLEDESLADRLAALRDMIPPSQRRYISSSVSTASSWLRSGLQLGGKGLWLVSTSVMLLSVPWALAYAEEQQMAEMEKEMQAQKAASEVSHMIQDMGEGEGEG